MDTCLPRKPSGAEISAELFDEGALVTHFTPVMFGTRGQTLAGMMRALAGRETAPAGRAMRAARKLPQAVRAHRSDLAGLCQVAQMLSQRLGMQPSVHGLFAHLPERWSQFGAAGTEASCYSLADFEL